MYEITDRGKNKKKRIRRYSTESLVFLGGSLEGAWREKTKEVCVEKRLVMALVERLVGKSAKEGKGKGRRQWAASLGKGFGEAN